MFLTISMPFHQTFSRWFGRAPSNWELSTPLNPLCRGRYFIFHQPFLHRMMAGKTSQICCWFQWGIQNGNILSSMDHDGLLFFWQISLGSCTFRASHWSANLCCPSCICCALATLGHGDVGRGARGAGGAAGAADGGEVQPTSWGKGCPGWK